MPALYRHLSGLILLASALSGASCERTADRTRFELVAPETSGVTFVNALSEDTASKSVYTTGATRAS